MRTKDILILSAFFGVITGLAEGAGLLTFQNLHWLTWTMAQTGVSAPILWISPFFGLIFFLGIGIAAALVLPLLPVPWRFRACVFAFSFLLFFDWLLLVDRIRDAVSIFLSAGLATVTARWAAPREDLLLRIAKKVTPVAVVAAILVLAAVEGGGRWKEHREIARVAPAASGAPNILVIVVDTLRADHLASYGYSRATSPHIDEIAKQGVLFERAIATSSWTLPSHASMLTGRYPHEYGANMVRADSDFPVIGQTLIERGYRTGAFSGNTLFFSQSLGFGRGFHHFEDYFCNLEDIILRTVYGRMIYRYGMRPMGKEDLPARKSAGDINRALLRWVGSQPQLPFFAFLNYMDTHDPYLPPQPFRRKFSKLTNPGGRINEFVGRHRPKLTPEQLQSEIDAYDGAIAYVDDEIGKLMEELKKRGLAENTLVIITSDHGESLGEHGLFTHRNALYRNVIQVPLVFYWPGHVPANVRVATPVSQILLPATLADLTGGNQGIFPGESMAKLWKDTEPRTDSPLPLSELAQMHYERMKPAPAYYGAMRSVVSPEWHYIHNDGLEDNLFSWELDPGEKNSVANTPKGQKAMAELLVRMKEEQARSEAAAKFSLPARAN